MTALRASFRPALLLTAAMAANGCTPEVEAPGVPVTLPEAFSADGDADQADQWWTGLGDEALDGLVAEALRGNLDLRRTWDRLAQARAVARQRVAPLLPSLDGTAGGSRTLTSIEGHPRAYQNEVRLGLAADYELDLWGRVRSAYEASELDVRAAEQDLRSAAMTLSAEVAGAWYRVVELRRQLDLLDAQSKTNGDYLDIITVMFRRGQASATDVLQQRQLLESTRGERVQAEGDLAVERHALAVLLGREPMGFRAPESRELPTPLPLPRTGLPAERIAQRPDVRAAQLRVRAADHRVAAAIADRFPRVGLTATGSTSAERVRELFDNWLASMAANAAAPLFDAGLRAAEVDRARAAADEQLHAYGRAVLASLREVEDALRREAKQREYLGSLRKQVELSRQASDQTRRDYMKGGGDFVRFLTTLLSHQRLERTYLQARRRLVQFRIDLYRALGGGWEVPEPPRPARRVHGPVERLRRGLASPGPAAPGEAPDGTGKGDQERP